MIDHPSAAPYMLLDPRQLIRIEAMHRGFFYQHLYAASILLRAQQQEVQSLEIEQDEDIELQFEGHRVYLQVKTRNAPLQPHDVASALERFEKLRSLHASGARSDTLDYWIISNSSASPSLVKKSEKWPSYLHLSTPSNHGELLPVLPSPRTTVEELLAAATTEADLIPCGGLSGETLVLKLAACIQAAAAGTPPRINHRFNVEELPTLFEQVTQQLQTFPAIPVPYLAHDEEPKYESESNIRMVTGHSGSGKTAWASEASLHSIDQGIYFDIGDTASASLPASLARELSAKLYPSGGDRRNILRPGNTGLDSLRAINQAISRDSQRVSLYLDNCQRIEAEDVAGIAEALSEFRLIVLAQPSPREKTLASLLSVTTEVLSGWSIEVIASHFADVKCPIDLPTAETVRHLTGGLPLYVLNTARLAIEVYGNNVAQLCTEIELATHPTATAQELILARVFDALEEAGKTAAAAILLSDVPLRFDEAREIVAIALEDDSAAAAQALRATTTWSIINSLRDTSLVIHDAFRVLITEERHDLGNDICFSIRRRLKEMMLASIPTARDLSRHRFFFRLLPLIGQTDELVSLATSASESFREMGLVDDAFPVLLEAAQSENTPTVDRIWAYDTLAMWATQDAGFNRVDEYVSEMERLAATTRIPNRLAGEIESKKMLRAGRAGNIKEARRHLKVALDLSTGEEDDKLILRYNFANAAYFSNEYTTVLEEADRLIADYYTVLGLQPQDVFAKNPPEILARIKKLTTRTIIYVDWQTA